jgi:hypothetical protein
LLLISICSNLLHTVIVLMMLSINMFLLGAKLHSIVTVLIFRVLVKKTGMDQVHRLKMSSNLNCNFKQELLFHTSDSRYLPIWPHLSLLSTHSRWLKELVNSSMESTPHLIDWLVLLFFMLLKWNHLRSTYQ